MHSPCPDANSLVNETPVAVTVNGLSHAVMMVTNQHLTDFAYGFACSERLIDEPNQIRDIHICTAPNLASFSGFDIAPLTLDIELSPRQLSRYKQRQVQRLGNSGCGLCGNETLAQAFPPLPTLPPSPLPSAELLSQWRELLPHYQTLGQQMGGLHCALLISPQGEVVAAREDIGRHNALDKVIGYGLTQLGDLTGHHVLMSSRCSTELVQKAVLAGLAGLVHLASPSQLAVAQARKSRLALIHLTKYDGPRVYSPAD